MDIQSTQIKNQLQTMLSKRESISDPFYSYSHWNDEALKTVHSVTSNYASLLSLIGVVLSDAVIEVRKSSAFQLLSYFPLSSVDLTCSLFSSDLISSILSLLTSPQSLTWGVLGIEPLYSFTEYSYEFLLANFRLFIFYLKACISKKVELVSFGDIRLPLNKIPCLLLPCIITIL